MNFRYRPIHIGGTLINRKAIPTDTMIKACYKALFNHIIRSSHNNDNFRDNVPRWMGHKVIKFPDDLLLYQQVLYNKKPDILIETGTRFGGSALFYANMFDLLGHGQVITIDVNDFPKKPKHPRIIYLIGKSVSGKVLDDVHKIAYGKKCMVSLDSSHKLNYVRGELYHYHQYVSPGQYLVVEDAQCSYKQALIKEFLSEHENFIKTDITDQFLVHTTKDGWIKRR